MLQSVALVNHNIEKQETESEYYDTSAITEGGDDDWLTDWHIRPERKPVDKVTWKVGLRGLGLPFGKVEGYPGSDRGFFLSDTMLRW